MLAFYSISILHCVIKSTLLAAYVRRGLYILPITPFASAAIPRGRPSRNCEEIAVEPAVLITLP
jgi:hypothetical protein